MRQAAEELNSKRLLPLWDCRACSPCSRLAAVSAGLSTTVDRGGRERRKEFKDKEIEGVSKLEEDSKAREDSEVGEDSKVGEDSEVKENSKYLSCSLTVMIKLQIRYLSLILSALHMWLTVWVIWGLRGSGGSESSELKTLLPIRGYRRI